MAIVWGCKHSTRNAGETITFLAYCEYNIINYFDFNNYEII